MLTVSVPGKLHLLGEHVVVYGKPALLAAVDKRIYISIKYQVLGIKYKREVVIETTERDGLIYYAIEVFKKAFSIKKLPPIEITIDSQIPTGCGLGSSAAVAAATIGALMKFVKNIWDPIRINDLTFEVEKKAHGTPSGADNSTVVFGGLIWYRREFDFLKSISNLSISLYKIPPFVLIDTGQPEETTREMVQSVAKLYARNRISMEEVFNDQEEQTKKLLLSLKRGNKKDLISAIKKGQNNLEKIGVVGNFAKKIIREIESIGGVAKICGAGGKKKGSGILLCYHQDLVKIENIGKKYNAAVSKVKLGEEGVRVE